MLSEPDLQHWFVTRIPAGWFAAPPEVAVDAEEILVEGELAGEAGADEIANGARIERFREESREKRMRIAADAERRFRRKVAWAARSGPVRQAFSSLSVPVMTRLRMPERLVLDTLVEAGVARSRSDALAWCVRLVGRHQADWIEELRKALVQVGEVRRKGPS